ncbi:MAG: hypothetical protein Q4G61_11095 [Tissierellia bacterium]|nr:hypothetical protein [Tissierellia bacterium]
MRVTIRKVNGKEYVYIHESYRDPETGKPKHRTIESFGRLDLQLEKDPEFLNKLYARVEEHNCKTNQQNDLIRQMESFEDTLKEDSPSNACYVFGYGVFLYKKVYGMILPFSKMNWLTPAEKELLSYANTIKIFNAGEPVVSALEEMNWSHREPYILPGNTLTPQKTHRMLEKFGKNKQAFEKLIYHHIEERIPSRLIAYIYDICRLDFERVYKGDLDYKDITPQTPSKRESVVMTLVTDERGLPLGFELFSGERAHTSQILKAIQRIQDLLQMENITIVSNRGLMDQDTLREIDRLGYDYILATKIVSATEGLDQRIFQDRGYTRTYQQDSTELLHKYQRIPGHFKYANTAFPLEGTGDLTLYFSPKLAANDRRDRDNLTLDEMYRCSVSVLHGGAGRNAPIDVQVLNDEEFSMNINQFLKKQRFSGYRILLHSNPDLTQEQLCKIYTNYWKMTFLSKLFKNYFDELPKFHWTNSAIIGAYTLCYVSIMAQMILEMAAEMAGLNASTEDIVTAIQHANVTVLRKGEELLLLKTKTPPLFDALSEKMGLASLNTVETMDSFASKMKLTSEEVQEILNHVQ